MAALWGMAEKGLSYCEEIEKQLLKKAMDASQGNASLAAKKLTLSREAMRYRLKKHGLE